MNKKILAAVAVMFPLACLAQSSPGFTTGFTPTAGQWNSYFAGKMDYVAPSTSGNCFLSNGSTWYSGTCPFPSTVANLAGGSAGSIPYQSAPNTTAMLAPGAGLLQGGTTPSYLPLGVSVNNPGTNTLEALMPVQTVSGASRAFSAADLFQKTRRSNSGAAMTDTFPAASVSGITNGTEINIANTDATATDVVTAGTGTTIGGASTFVVQPGRDVWFTYDAPNTTWRAMANTGSSLLFSGTPASANQLYAGSGVPGNAAAMSVAQLKTLVSQLPNVMDPAYGAKCDNSTDDTAAFTAIAAAVPLFALPAGRTCVISSAITLSATAGMGIVGYGENSSVIRINSTTAEGIVLPAGANNPFLSGFAIIRNGMATSTATNLDVSGGTSGGRFERMVISSGYNNILLGPTDHGGMRDILTELAVNHGLLMKNSSSSGSLQWQLDNVLSAQNGGSGFIVAAVNNGPAGITMGEWRSCQTFANTGYGIAFLGLSSVPIQGIRLRDIFVGADGAQEIYLDTYSSNGNSHIIESPFIEMGGLVSTGPTLSTPATNTASGILITANNGIVNINNAVIDNNAADGIYTQALSTVVNASVVTNNGAGAIAQRGIINAGAGRLIVENSQVGNTSGISTQLYGIAIVSGTDYNLIIGNDLRGNSTGPIFNSSTGSNNHIELNSGYNSAGPLAYINASQTFSGTNSWVGQNTFSNGDLILLGSGTGASTFSSANSSATNYALTFPAITDTVTTNIATQTLTNKTLTSAILTTPTLTSPTMTTPNLGTPSAVVLTNATGTASGLSVGTATNQSGGTVTATSGSFSTSIALSGVLESATAPSYASGGCASHSALTANGTAAFSVQMTGACSGSQPIMFTLPAAAHSWACQGRDISSSSVVVHQTGPQSTTSVTMTAYSVTTGSTTAWFVNDIIEVTCTGY